MTTLTKKLQGRTVAAYPKFFTNFRRGSGASGDELAELAANMNKFAQDYGLVKAATSGWPDVCSCAFPLRTKSKQDYDHPELYRNAEGEYVLVVSNYNAPPPPALKMTEIAPIYIQGATSYAGTYATLKELRAAVAAAKLKG